MTRRRLLLVAGLFLVSFAMFFAGLPHRKRHGDPNYGVVHTCLGLIYTSGQCEKLSIVSDKTFDGDFVSCDSDRGILLLRNKKNGDVLRLDRRPNLFFFPGTDHRSLVVDMSNGFVFLTSDGLILNFRRASSAEIKKFRSLGDNVRIEVSKYW